MQKKIEQKALIISSVINFIMAAAGIWVFSVTKIQAIFIDGVFSLIGLISLILAAVLSKESRRKTKSYPDGLVFLEPLYAILKSLLTLILLIISVVTTSITAYQYFTFGIGNPMNIDPVIPYTITMVILCFGLGLFNKKQNQKINNLSTILAAESKANFVDGILSMGVGVAIIILYLIDINGSLGFLHYTGDFFITVILVLISLKQPVKMIVTSFIEITHGNTSDSVIKSKISKVLKIHLGSIIQHKRIDILKVGMHIKIRIILSDNMNDNLLIKLIEARKSIVNDLKSTYENVQIVFVL